MSRRGWEFSQSVKDEAWRIAKQNGSLPPEITRNEVEFNHKIPIAVARKLGLSKAIITGISNCEPLLKEAHKVLHQSFSLTELAEQNWEIYTQNFLIEP